MTRSREELEKLADEFLGELPPPPDFTGVETPELVMGAIRDEFSFKDVDAELKKRPPSRSAAEQVIDAYRRGQAPPWLAALLLGGCRDGAGYCPVREILLAAPGSGAESYGGVAMAEINGTDATADLIEILMTASERRSREGAAYGLVKIGSPEAGHAILQAALSGKIMGWTARHLLDEFVYEESVVLDLLQSKEEKRRAMGTEIVWSYLLNREKHPSKYQFRKLISEPSPSLRGAVESTLSDPNLDMSPGKRKMLGAWLAQCGP